MRHTPHPKPRVLFLCTGNSCRSQMAEAFANALLGDRVQAYSAGVAPQGMNARAVAAMSEVGIDLAGGHSKHVDSLADVAFDLVVTVCNHADETCPAFPVATRVLHVGFDDPPKLAATATNEEDAMRHYRRVRDEIHDYINNRLMADVEGESR